MILLIIWSPVIYQKSRDMSASILVILCHSSADSLLFSFCSFSVCKTLSSKHLQTHIYRVTRTILRKRISAFEMYSQEGHIKRVFLEVRHEGLHIQPCMWWAMWEHAPWNAELLGKSDRTRERRYHKVFLSLFTSSLDHTHLHTPSSWLFSSRYTCGLTSGAFLLLLIPSHPHPWIWEHKTDSNHKTRHSSFLTPINFLYLKKY